MTPAHKTTEPDVSHDLIAAIESFPVHRDVTHCGVTFPASALAIYANCPVCNTPIKLRSFSAVPELEDVFDAVLAWMNQPGADQVAQERRRVIAADAD